MPLPFIPENILCCMPSDSPRQRRRNVVRPIRTAEMRKDRLRRISELETRSTKNMGELTRQLAHARTTLSALRNMTDRASSTQITDLRVRIRHLEDRIANQTEFLGKLNKRKKQ